MTGKRVYVYMKKGDSKVRVIRKRKLLAEVLGVDYVTVWRWFRFGKRVYRCEGYLVYEVLVE